MLFSRPVVRTKTTVIDGSGGAVVAASDTVISKKEAGRHTISITASGGTVYIGGEDVTVSTGMPVADGETVTIPVATTRTDQVYITGGSAVLTEWFG